MRLKENREIWVHRVKDYKSSNLTQTAWCEKNSVKVSTLRYWLRTLGQASSVARVDSLSSGFEFASVSITENFSSHLVLEIKGVKLSITNDYDEVLLLRLIKSLQKL